MTKDEAFARLGKSKFRSRFKLTLVTDHERESVVSNDQTVEVVPAADWLRQGGERNT